MHNELISDMIINVMGGLAIFLLGMHNMSTGLQTVAGDRLRKLIGTVTNNRIVAAFVGTFVTSIIQSSSVTTVMVVGFVNSSLMTLKQALGVIMGANIGTTFTAWILVLKVGKYGLPILAIAAFFYLFSKKEKTRFVAMTVMGIGMVFFGLHLMKDGFKPIRSMPEFEAWFHAFDAHTYFGVLKTAMVGCILTLIVQSSSATIGITIGLASTGVISFTTAAALVLGENIGTTITAFLASLTANTNAKRAAYGHVIFNILGVAWITALFPFYLGIIKHIFGQDPGVMVMKDGVETYPYVQAAIAMVHSGFNIVNTIMFLPFINYLAKLLEKIVPDKEYEEAPKLTKLDIRIAESPIMIVEQTKAEIMHVWSIIDSMFSKLKVVIQGDIDKNEKEITSLFKDEENVDVIQKEITAFLMEAVASEMPVNLVAEAQAQIRIADELESVSDYIISVLKLRLKIKDKGLSLSDAKKEGLLRLHNKTEEYASQIMEVFNIGSTGIESKAKAGSDMLTHIFKEIRKEHLERISSKAVDPMLGISYMNMLSSYRKMRGHMLNVCEAFCSKN